MTIINSAISSVLITVIIIMMHSDSFAQDRCGTVELLEKKRHQSAIRESDADFEQWMKQRSAARKGRSSRTGAYRVPVVFHVVHRGEALGSGGNISDAQLVSQIAVLNRDYNRTNADASSTPAEFAAVAGSMPINFVLARQDPDGNPTTGIVRVKGTQSQWSINDESSLKALSYWPAENYLNIWVTDLSSSLLGYAQFPLSDLAGLEDAQDNRLTDGVVVDYTVVGSNEDGTFNLTSSFNRGRSATHEVGHFFGLRHIWGDDDGACSGRGDYVADTPNQGNSTNGCPTHPQTSCTAHSMFQNYMDYTNDACMNLFTNGQVARMITVIEGSPRRASLLVSPGADDPSPVANDVALLSMESPGPVMCEAISRPTIRIMNKGTNAVTAVTLKFSTGVDSVLTRVLLSQPLLPSAGTTVTLDAVSSLTGVVELTASVVSVNDATDGKLRDNLISGTAYLYDRAGVPYRETFETSANLWRISNTSPAWSTVTANNGAQDNHALGLNGVSASSGDTATAITPRFVFSHLASPYLVFDVAYAVTSARSPDRLEIYALGACSDDISLGQLIYSKSGNDLATAAASSSFLPAGALEWRQEVIDLASIAFWTEVRFAVVVARANANIYIDNFQFVEGVSEDVELANVEDFGPASCNPITSASLTLVNHGPSTLRTVDVQYTSNSADSAIISFHDLSVLPGRTVALTMADIPTPLEKNTIQFKVLHPNGLFDIHESDNVFEILTLTNSDTDIIPNRTQFGNDNGLWHVISPYGGNNWSLATTNNGGSMSFQPNGLDTREAWLVSPTLDFSVASEASVFFDVSRPAFLNGLLESKEDARDTLTLMVSTDCGRTYRTHTRRPLPVNDPGVLVPENELNWTHTFIDLTTLAGMPQVRLAWVVKNPSASVYLDNIEFFVSSDPTPVAAEQPFSIYGTDPSSPSDFYITFHLDTRKDVSYTLFDMTGRSLMTTNLTDVLNQTYTVVPTVSAGVYLVSVRIGTEVYTSRVFIVP